MNLLERLSFPWKNWRGTNVAPCSNIVFAALLTVTLVDAAEDEAMKAISSLFLGSNNCVNIKLFEDVLSGVATEKQQFIASHKSTLERKNLYIQTLKSYWCAIGWTGGPVWQNVTSLAAITGLVRLVPQHIVILEGSTSPTKRELDMQNRQLIWKQQTEKVGFFCLITGQCQDKDHTITHKRCRYPQNTLNHSPPALPGPVFLIHVLLHRCDFRVCSCKMTMNAVQTSPM